MAVAINLKYFFFNKNASFLFILGGFYFINNHILNDLKKNNKENDDLPNCSQMPRKLKGRIQPELKPSNESIKYKYTSTYQIYKPSLCHSEEKVAIIIAYRNRPQQLKIFLHNIHPLLERQNIEYGIFIISQAGEGTFNKVMLFNIGFTEASKTNDWNCFIFHDVDLIPEDDRNLYLCTDNPRHMSVSVDKFNYKLLYEKLFGGVVAFTKNQFVKVNGYSNQFFGWGGEDDNMAERVVIAGYDIQRVNNETDRYTMIKHGRDWAINRDKDKIRSQTMVRKQMQKDGLTSLKYKLENIVMGNLYTNITVQIRKDDATLPIFQLTEEEKKMEKLEFEEEAKKQHQRLNGY